MKISSSQHPPKSGASEIENVVVEIISDIIFQFIITFELFQPTTFDYNASQSDNLRMAPFELNLERMANYLWDLICVDEIPIENLSDFHSKLKTMLEDTQ